MKRIKKQKFRMTCRGTVHAILYCLAYVNTDLSSYVYIGNLARLSPFSGKHCMYENRDENKRL